jgi:hypothetical protein
MRGVPSLVGGRILKRKTNLLNYSSANMSGFARVYNLPIYFQAIDGVSPSESGIRVLPTILALCKYPCDRRMKTFQASVERSDGRYSALHFHRFWRSRKDRILSTIPNRG